MITRLFRIPRLNDALIFLAAITLSAQVIDMIRKEVLEIDNVEQHQIDLSKKTAEIVGVISMIEIKTKNYNLTIGDSVDDFSKDDFASFLAHNIHNGEKINTALVFLRTDNGVMTISFLNNYHDNSSKGLIDFNIPDDTWTELQNIRSGDRVKISFKHYFNQKIGVNISLSEK